MVPSSWVKGIGPGEQWNSFRWRAENKNTGPYTVPYDVEVEVSVTKDFPLGRWMHQRSKALRSAVTSVEYAGLPVRRPDLASRFPHVETALPAVTLACQNLCRAVPAHY